MAEELNEKKELEAGGADADPTPSPTTPQSSEENFADLIANLQRKIDAQDGEIRALKSGKDKAVDRVVRSNEEMLAKFAKYLNVDENQIREAQRQSVMDELIEERMGGRNQTGPTLQGSGGGNGSQVELQYIDTALEFPENDSRVTDLKLKYGNDPVAYLREGMKLAQSLKTTSPTPAEQLPPQGGSASSSSAETAALIERFDLLAKSPTKNRDELKAIKAKLEARGWK